MRWQGRKQSSNVEDRRGQGSRIGGKSTGIIGIIILLVGAYYGVDLSGMVGSPATGTQVAQQSTLNSQQEAQLNELARVVLADNMGCCEVLTDSAGNYQFDGIAPGSYQVQFAAPAGLGFLGLGAQPPTPEWGAMVSTGRAVLLDQWWVSTIPGIPQPIVLNTAFRSNGGTLHVFYRTFLLGPIRANIVDERGNFLATLGSGCRRISRSARATGRSAGACRRSGSTTPAGSTTSRRPSSTLFHVDRSTAISSSSPVVMPGRMLSPTAASTSPTRRPARAIVSISWADLRMITRRSVRARPRARH